MKSTGIILSTLLIIGDVGGKNSMVKPKYLLIPVFENVEKQTIVCTSLHACGKILGCCADKVADFFKSWKSL